jgi:transposase
VEQSPFLRGQLNLAGARFSWGFDIAVQKYVMAVPLYRQEQEWNRLGIELSRQTMSNWLIKATFLWLEPIYSEST